jgi:hypothetical protein
MFLTLIIFVPQRVGMQEDAANMSSAVFKIYITSCLNQMMILIVQQLRKIQVKIIE